MSHFIVDLEVIGALETSLRKRLKPDEILLISYIKNFPNGYYGSKENLAFVLGMSRASVFRLLKYYKEKKILNKDKNKYFFALIVSN
ncbi:MAG: hypothetical protein U0L65_03410 [Bacteroidales bacterium]|jgi:hypothetical protein|nr:hypothetical protein [Bacteroidales bacterium]MEE0882451.1 hypothetical protein [Bacteroidales bacterium]